MSWRKTGDPRTQPSENSARIGKENNAKRLPRLLEGVAEKIGAGGLSRCGETDEHIALRDY